MCRQANATLKTKTQICLIWLIFFSFEYYDEQTIESTDLFTFHPEKEKLPAAVSHGP